MNFEDFDGTPLSVGDRVVVIDPNGRYSPTLSRYEIVRFVNRHIRLRVFNGDYEFTRPFISQQFYKPL